MINKLLLENWLVHGGCIIIPNADHRQDCLRNFGKKRDLPVHSFSPAGLQMPEDYLAIRPLLLMREIHPEGHTLGMKCYYIGN